MENDVTKHDKQDQQALDDVELTEAGTDANGAAGATVDGEDDPVDELETLRAERDSYLDQLQRSVAEFANYRRRNEQERAQLVPVVRRDLLAQFLPIVDDFERALAQVPDDERETGWMTGITMIESKLKGLLERAGVTAIDPAGEPFDPSRHEAVASDPGSSGQTVVEVYQKGYAIGDVLIRPAMVKTGATEDAERPASRADA